MFGGFIGSNNAQGKDWGENLLNTVASNTIRHLFTESELVEVSVRCNPSSKLLQGTIDSFKMNGKGLVIRRQFRTEEMSFETDAVSLDFSSVLQGKIALKQSTQAIAQVTLQEEDINQSFKADLVKKRLENLSLPALQDVSEGKPVSFTDVEIKLLTNNQIILNAVAKFAEQIIPVSMSCQIAVAKRRRILFNNVEFLADSIPESMRSTSQNLTLTLGEILNEMVDLDRFELDGVTIRLNRLETSGKALIFSGYAQIERVPTTG
jgi:LmeA-like phospholipid-binding